MLLQKLGKTFFAFLVIVSLLPGATTQGLAAPDAAHSVGLTPPKAPLDTPTALVSTGVTLYTIASPKVFWYTGVPACPPQAPQSSGGLQAPSTTYPEEIQRIPTYGGLSRTLYYRDADCGTGDLLSNMISDGTNLYWMSQSQGGIVRLSTDANPGDAPQLVSNAVSGSSELTQAGGDLYVLVSGTPGSVWQVAKDGSSANEIVANAGNDPVDFQCDGGWLYWLTGGNLEQWDLYYQSLFTAASGVTGYGIDPIGRGFFIAQGDKMTFYSNEDDTYTPILPGGGSGQIVEVLADAFNIFYFDKFAVDCSPFCSYQYQLLRAGKDGSSPTAIFISPAIFTAPYPMHLLDDGSYIFWQDAGGIERLAKNASGLPLINLHVTGLEITQSIQNQENTVQLIEDKRTFVRVYIKSDGVPVPGVTAYLYQIDSNGFPVAGPLVPVNPVGQTITVQPNPQRNNLNDAFLFELPWNWLTGSIRLRAVLNPNGVPPQASYADNQLDSSTFTFVTSPRLEVQFVGFGYVLNNQIYYPRLTKDIIQTYSWIRRAYPLASTPGFFDDPTPGFRPNLWLVGDDNLGSRVNQTDPSCNGLKDKSLCASGYTNSLLQQMRTDNGLASSLFLYGMISNAAGFPPRGQAGASGTLVSSGPAGISWGGSSSWDTDGSFADWYAGHEIGHTLGRDHPWKGSSLDDSLCGQTPSDGALDTNYPYTDGQIGQKDNTLEGFNTGDGELGIPPAIYPGTTWYDNMSYCPNKWISDYTYNGMYSYMINHPSAPAINSPTGVRVTGDLLGVYGEILPDSNTAIINILSRESSVAQIPAIIPGDYSIRLVGASGTLADYAFTPQPIESAGETTLGFAQVVNFVPGTTQVQIIRLAGNQVLASHAVSPHAPALSNVALQGAPNPVTGTVTLAWTASDADGDPLTFNLLYSRDGGATFQPLLMNQKGSSVQIDTSRLGGSTSAILRVVASDGVNTTTADTAPFTMANKLPVPSILLPGDGLHIHYGQLVNFSGQAEDFQDGGVSGSNLVWSNQKGPLGTGPLISSTTLPVGANLITLTATNSLGLSASASITVYVDDDLNLPGPTLAAGPGLVSLHVAPGVTTPQTEDISISNTGSGTLSWTATSGASWLTLSAPSGTAPSILTLTLDPSGLKSGDWETSNLVLTSPAASDHITETLTIPVSLSMGDLEHLSRKWIVDLPVIIH